MSIRLLPWTIPLVVGVIGVIDMPSTYWPGDPFAWREEARAIINNGTLSIDQSVIPAVGERGQSMVVNQTDLQIYSKYGIMNSIVSLPPMLLDRLLNGPSPPLIAPNLLIMNLWNVSLSVLLAAVLMRISSLYSARIWTQSIFVLTAFYTTFLWYYVRAQSSEIYQTLFFASGFLMLVTFLRSAKTATPASWRLDVAWLFVGMLVLTRILYLLLIPLMLLFLTISIQQRRGLALRLLPHALVPPVLIVALLGWVNYVKFGSPLLSGYHQWQPEQHLLTGHFGEGLWGFLFHPRFSIFLHFPLLLVALPAMWVFLRRYPSDAVVAILAAATFVMFLAKIPTWAGEWSYGPRYVLFLLPELSLPAILVIDWLIDNRRRLVAQIAAGCLGMGLIYSMYLQLRVNQASFFAYYEIRKELEPDWPPSVQAYFLEHNVGIITDSLRRHRDDLDVLPWFDELKRALPAEEFEAHRKRIIQLIDGRNHYWF